jgi:hypothetical protein
MGQSLEDYNDWDKDSFNERRRPRDQLTTPQRGAQYPTALHTKKSGQSGTATPTTNTMRGSPFSTPGLDTPTTTAFGGSMAGSSYFDEQGEAAQHHTRHDPVCDKSNAEPDCPDGTFNDQQLNIEAQEIAQSLYLAKQASRSETDSDTKAQLQTTIDEGTEALWKILHEVSPKQVPYRDYITEWVRSAKPWTVEECKEEVTALACRGKGFPETARQAWELTVNNPRDKVRLESMKRLAYRLRSADARHNRMAGSVGSGR